MSVEGVYEVTPERYEKACAAIYRSMLLVEHEDVAGIMIEIGIGQNASWTGGGNDLHVELSPMQTIAVAACLAAYAEHLTKPVPLSAG